MSKRSASLIKIGLVGLLLVALMVGAFQVLMEDEPTKPEVEGATTAAASDDPSKPELVPGASGETAKATTPDAKAESLPAPGAAPSAGASAPSAAPRSTWTPAEGSFTGTVRREDGAGLAGARVALLTIDPERMKGFPEGMRAMWLAQMKKQGRMTQLLAMMKSVETKTTDAQGRFELKAPDGKVEHWLRIQHPQYVGVFSNDFKGAPRSLSVTLLRAATVVVTVTTPDGSPVKMPQVSIEADEKTAPQVQAAPLAFTIDTAPTQRVSEHGAALKASVEKRVAAEAVTSAKASSKTKAEKAKAEKAKAGKAEVAKAAPAPIEEVAPPPPAELPTHTRTLTQIPAGRHTVYASADGFKTTSAELNVIGGEEHQVAVTLQVGLSLQGVVVDERGEPIAKATVSGWQQGAWQGKRKHMRSLSAQTDADGKFTIKGLEKTVYRFNAHRTDFQQTNWNVTGTPGGEPLRIVLNRTYVIRGKVVIEPGGEAAGAGLQVNAESKSRQWFGRGAAVTKEDGSFELRQRLPARYRLSAKGAKHTSLDAVPVVVKDGDVDGVVIKVQAGATAEVLVVSTTGGPVEGAKVMALTGEQARWAGQAFRAGRAGPETPTTDKDGKTRIEGLGPGEYKVLVVKDGFAQGDATLRVDEGQEPKQVRVALAPGATLSATILNADGTPFAGKTIAIMPKDATLMSPAAFQNATATDEQGKLTKTGLTAGDYRLQAMNMGGGGGGSLSPVGEVRLQAGQTTTVELRLKAAAATVSGRVLKGTRPQPGVQVMVYQENDLLAGFAQTTTDAEGRFKAEKLGAGTYVVTASGAAKTTVKLGESSAAEVTLEIQAGVVAGRIVGPDGAPAAGARIFLQRTDAGATLEDSFRASESTDGLGFFKLSKVRPGSYRLIASAPGVGSSKGMNLTLTADEAKTGLNVALTAGGTLELTVANPDAKPAVGASVNFYHVGLKFFSEQVQGWGSGGSSTDRHGKVKLENLIPGTYVVFVSSAGNKQALLENVTVGEGGLVAKTATLEKPGTLEIRAAPDTRVTVELASSGTPVGGTGMPWASLFGLAKTDASGVLKVPNLPQVEVRVKGTTPDGKPAGSWRGTITAGETTQAPLN